MSFRYYPARADERLPPVRSKKERLARKALRDVVRTDPVLVSPVTKVGASPPIQLTLRETDMARAYQVLEGDVVLIDATRNPMTEAAALLLERGEPRSTKLEFRFEGEQQVAMSRWVGHQ